MGGRALNIEYINLMQSVASHARTVLKTTHCFQIFTMFNRNCNDQSS